MFVSSSFDVSVVVVVVFVGAGDACLCRNPGALLCALELAVGWNKDLPERRR